MAKVTFDVQTLALLKGFLVSMRGNGRMLLLVWTTKPCKLLWQMV